MPLSAVPLLSCLDVLAWLGGGRVGGVCSSTPGGTSSAPPCGAWPWLLQSEMMRSTYHQDNEQGEDVLERRTRPAHASALSPLTWLCSACFTSSSSSV